MLTSDRLRELVSYDPETGVFIRLQSTAPNARRGQVAGSTRKRGYLEFRVDGALYKAHRLAWLYMTGNWPAKDIDHIDGCTSNNRWSNLREASKHVNLQNLRKAMRSNTTTGLLGSSLDRSTGRFRAQITIDGATRRIGLFDTPELAHAAYLEAKRKLHEGCTI